MSTTRRLTQQEIKHEADPFFVYVERIVRFWRDHRTVLTSTMVALVLGLIALVGVLSWRSDRNEQASMALSELLELYRRPVAAVTTSGGDGETFASHEAKQAALIAETDAFLAAHGSTKAGRGAKMIKAQLLGRAGQTAEASQLLTEVIGGSVPDDAVGGAAFLARAEVQAAGGDVDGALSELQRLAGSDSPYVPKSLALERAAMIAEHAARKDEALTLYRRLETESEEGPAKTRAARKVEELSKDAPAGDANSGT